MDTEKGVKVSESPDDEKPESRSEPGESASSKSGERSVEQVVAENKRKADEIKELREEMTKLREAQLESREERLEQLQEKSRLTVAEKEEMATIEDQIASIKGDPRSKPWLRINEDTALRAASQKLAERDAVDTEDYVSELADQEKVPFEKFEREIVKYMRKVDPGAEMNTLRRAKKAYRLYKEEQTYSKRMDELKEKEKQFAETGGARTPRPQTKTELFESANKSEEGMRDLLKAVHASQDEATSR